MQRLVTGHEMKELDRLAMTEWQVPGSVLMENAGRATADVIEREFAPIKDKPFLIICGKGNNGGDGFVVARLLAGRGAKPACVLLAKATELKGDAKASHAALKGAGIPVHEVTAASELAAALEPSPVVVDAIFGTGLSNPPSGLAAEVIALVNRSDSFVVSVDVPSGLDADTGTVLEPAIRSDLTATMGLAKCGLLLYPGRACVGRLEVVDIGFPQQLMSGGDTFLLDSEHVRAVLPPRPPDGHKGTFGTALIIAGSRGFSGAACLAGMAAVRSGCGLVRLAIPRGIADIVESRVLEAVKTPLPETKAETISPAALDTVLELASGAESVAVGPGITTNPDTGAFLLSLLPSLNKPTVIDADGINNLADSLGLLKEVKAPLILTPHPGEFSRLTGLTAQQVNQDRISVARRFSTQYKVVLVLKGASTVIAGPDGKVLVNPTGNSGLGSGGTGDVLTGLMAGLLAQGMKPFDAAAAAVYLHGLSADIAARNLTEYCMSATDLLTYLPHAFGSILTP